MGYNDKYKLRNLENQVNQALKEIERKKHKRIIEAAASAGHRTEKRIINGYPMLTFVAEGGI